jgi:FMN phosphatase YigB (HAD superfamily)
VYAHLARKAEGTGRALTDVHIVSDFDGVWTDPSDEAAAVGAWQQHRLGEVLGGADPLAARLLSEVRDAVRRRPHAHGWIRPGGLSCYADEDPYVFHNAVATALWERGCEGARALSDAGYGHPEDFAAECFHAGTEAWRGSSDTHLLAGAVQAVEKILAAGHRVTIVSNSSTQRVLSILGTLGLDPAGVMGLEVHGGARKFELEADEPCHVEPQLSLAGRPIALRRPFYHRLLESLRPDVVIGDNLSLDLALPLALRDRGGWARDLRAVLKRNAYTPAWACEACEHAGAEIAPSLTALADSLA